MYIIKVIDFAVVLWLLRLHIALRFLWIYWKGGIDVNSSYKLYKYFYLIFSMLYTLYGYWESEENRKML